jgi:predicted aminopeptidase
MKRALLDVVPLRYWARGQGAVRRGPRYRWVASLGCLGLCTLLLNGCSLGYLWHVTVGQAKLLVHQQPVAEMLQNSSLSAQEQQKLRLILAVRAFAIEHLGLHASDSYTTFVQVDGPYVSYNLSAASKDALRPYTWWFPIVGRLPYKGFFNKAAALREEHVLAEQGYDTYVGGVRAFSTLGYFRDAILSCMLSYDDFSLISTVIHELLHRTVWVKGSVSFNESLANFVGDKGTVAYLTWRDGVAAPEVQRYQDIRADAGIFEAYMRSLIERLEAFYRQPISREEKIHQREQIFAQAKDTYPAVFPYMKTAHYQRFFEQRTLNNAVLLSFRLYHRDSAFFEQALIAQGGDLRQMIAFFKTLRPDQIPATFRPP